MTRRRMMHYLLLGAAALGLGGIGGGLGIYLYVAPSLPSVGILKDIHLQVPLRIYTRDGRLISVIGTKRRIPLDYSQIPPLQVEAFIAAEDDRFFEHPGLDIRSMARAVINLILTGRKSQGASTITMQLARNFFLTRKKLYIRKIREVFLALRIENELSKEDILRLYLNKIYLGNHAYGVGAAAEVYYGKDVWRLDLAQMAMIAGLPKAPSIFNPIADPRRALERRAYVLGRMRDLGFIDTGSYKRAMAAPISARLHAPQVSVQAPYVAEMVRNYMVQHYGDAVYTAGFQVTTTIDSRLEKAAHLALVRNLERITRERGWRGPVANIPLDHNHSPKELAAQLAPFPQVADLVPGIITRVAPRTATVAVANTGDIPLGWKALSWAAGDKTQANRFLKPGDVVYLQHRPDGWQIFQIPAVQGALVALDPYDGAIVALDGGFSYTLSKFNRALQAHRQLGSSFKPYIYSAALQQGLTPATLISNAPLIAVANQQLAEYWRPTNYERNTSGMVRLREGLIHSINLVSVRVLERVGIPAAIRWVRRFGFDPAQIPHNLTMVLGSASLTPLEMARGYAVFANGGFLVRPYFIQRIEGPDDQLLARAHPWVACTACAKPLPARAPMTLGSPVAATTLGAPQTIAIPSVSTTAGTTPTAATGHAVLSQRQPAFPIRLAPRTLSPQIAYLMTNMMQGVIQQGTGRAARVIGHSDLAGKTGTTNDYSNAWFDGYAPRLVAITWVGYDRNTTLGDGQTGARAALPMWITFMRDALKGVPNRTWPIPPGLVTVRIDAKTGLRCGPGNPNAIWEVFRTDHVPPRQQSNQAPSLYGGG